MSVEKLFTGIQHIGIPTYDIEQTIEFYESIGFKVIYRTINEKVNEKVAFLKLKNVEIETYQSLKEANKPGSIDHIALDVTDIEDTFRIISKGGYKMLDETVQFLPFFENGVKFFTIMGPNGEKIEFSQKL